VPEAEEAVGENSRNRVKSRKIQVEEEPPRSPGESKSFITSKLVNPQGCGTNGTLGATHHSAQQLGNGAIVERLSGGRSFFDVRACGEGSKGYVGKRDARNKKSLAAASAVHDKAATINRKCPLNGQINWLAAAFIFARRFLHRKSHSQVVVSPQVYAIRRTFLRKFAQLQKSSLEIVANLFVSIE
jgi:hypothetical protein